jgi:hypothetical protein
VGRGRRFGVGVLALVTIAGFGATGWTPSAASRARRPIRPVLGDWEGRGPLGLRLSFAFVRRGGHVVLSYFALGLPTGCRSTGSDTWAAGEMAPVEYIAPGTVLHGPFPPLGPTQFELFLPPTKQNPFLAPFLGTFSSARRGVLSIESPTRVGCPHTAWPRTLRFALAATHRVAVADGLWTGTISSPAGMSGTVSIRVIDHGRIETDFSATYSCPAANAGGGGSFEIGPLATVGYLIAADGSIGGAEGTETAWRGRFAANGVINGTFIAGACSPTVSAGFTARRTAA